MSGRGVGTVTAGALGAASMLVVIGLVAHAGRAHAGAERHDPPTRALEVPLWHSPVVIDGELGDASWPTAARTGAFSGADDAVGKPFSEALFLRDSRNLYIALYAADEHLEAAARPADGPVWLDDSFHVVFELPEREISLDVSARGVLTDGVRRGGGPVDYRWSSGARVGVDADGTLDDPNDRDEEWVAELAVPFASLGLEPSDAPLDVRIVRHDAGGGTRARSVPGTTRVRLRFAR